MKKSLDNLKFQGENCSDNNRDKPVSENQLRTILIIEKYFKDIFNGNTFGDAWDFIKLYEGKTYYDDDGKVITIRKQNSAGREIESEHFYLDNIDTIDEADYNFQEDYFKKRYAALQKGEIWLEDDRLFDVFDVPNE